MSVAQAARGRLAVAGGLLAAGILHALSFAPGPLPGWLLPLLHLVTLAVLVRASLTAATPRRAAWGGWLFGLGMFCTGVYWLYISMHTYGFMPAPLAAGGVLALSVYLALYPALAAGLTRWLLAPGAAASTPRIALTWAAAWAAGEWLRATVFTGFPWLNAGYAHVDSPLAGWASIVGVHGVAFAAALSAAALALLWPALGAAGRDGGPRVIGLRHGAAVLATGIALGGWGLAQIQWWRPAGEPLRTLLVQGAVDQNDKFDPARLQAGLHRHLALAARPAQDAANPPALIVLPETIMPVFQDRLAPAVWQAWIDLAGQRDAAILMGAPIHARAANTITNSVIRIDGDTALADLQAGQPGHRYDKRHLVPFGEFIPPGFRWFVEAMSIPLGDFNRGPARQTPFSVDGQHVALNICYEDVFGEELLPALFPGDDGSPGATILVNVSNLGWFGDSWALRQHLQIARLRTLETARPMLRATNTGATAVIGPDGVVQAELRAMHAGTLDVSVQGTSGLTPYARVGNVPAVGGIVLILAFAAWRRRARHG
ncbi:Apolipoprotein N-acyltransferase / Copper homeostasis protein CutE [plant metagenome]|uniref:Apolipoprotein N-acyltransferase / Copper homeostasis protein CutE n=1 Tax=plant metagenome TaxID=1297885 RepID=A0A484U5X2_9ZZZZ